MASRYTLNARGESPPPRMTGQVVLVTGAAGGIGSEVSLACAREGATVITLDKNQHGLDRVYDDIIAAGGPEPVQVHEDLATLDAARAGALADQVSDAFGRLDAMIWLAHERAPLSPLEHFPEKTWVRVMHAAANSPWILFRTLAPLLRGADAPRVVLASGDAGRRTRAYHGATALGWGTLDTLARLITEEYERLESFRCFSVDPGPVYTPMRVGWYPGEGPDSIPLPGSVADAFVFLACADSARFDGPLCAVRDGGLESVPA